jgi:hypothetical protein
MRNHGPNLLRYLQLPGGVARVGFNEGGRLVTERFELSSRRFEDDVFLILFMARSVRNGVEISRAQARREIYLVAGKQFEAAID